MHACKFAVLMSWCCLYIPEVALDSKGALTIHSVYSRTEVCMVTR